MSRGIRLERLRAKIIKKVKQTMNISQLCVLNRQDN